MVLLIFAGSAAEFALNREVDWLFFTGKLPGFPVGRLISTASHARQIVFADEPTATPSGVGKGRRYTATSFSLRRNRPGTSASPRSASR